MADATQSRGPMKQSAWAPLRIKAFRALWLAQVGSMIGTWMQTVGAQWLLVEEPGADTLVAMVQVAAMLPMLVLALPSGALADILDRRRMLIGCSCSRPASRWRWPRSRWPAEWRRRCC